jgi:hypothetical protein
MKTKCLSLVLLVAVCMATLSYAQEKICINGVCQAGQAQSTIVLDPLREELKLVDKTPRATADGVASDRFDQVVRATVRVTVSGVCGSGTVVGRTSEGNAIVLTNAHVAGTTRWRSPGESSMCVCFEGRNPQSPIGETTIGFSIGSKGMACKGISTKACL